MKSQLLYKYRPWNEHTKQLIAKNEIFLTPPNFFNDPYDCLHSFWTNTKSELEETLKKPLSASHKRHIEDCIRTGCYDKYYLDPDQLNHIASNLYENYYLACFSSINDSILMFSHYADNHRGVCLIYNDNFGPLGKAHSVKYNNDFPIIDLISIINKKIDYTKFYLKKSKAWGYEKEKRIICSYETLSRLNGKDVTITEYGAKYSHVGTTLLGIIIGAKMTEDEIECIKCFLKRNMISIRIYKAVMDDRSYKLRIKPLCYTGTDLNYLSSISKDY